jgi:hypothetical protein
MQRIESRTCDDSGPREGGTPTMLNEYGITKDISI